MPPAAPGGQLPLALRFSADQRFDAFVQPPEGALPQLQALAAGRAQDWILVDGATGAGKTHLLLASCAHALESGHRAAYLPLQAAIGRVAEALQAFEGQDLVALDGLESIAGRRDDEVALFDFHNRARAAGASVLYASQARPAVLALDLPDLRSRLAQCTAISLAVLDDDGRRALLKLRANRRGLAFDDAALDWLLRRTGRDLAHLTALLDRLDREALAAQRRLTVPFLRQVLGDAK